mmetsp:Transcript_35767/g.89749  ORF Transcript_35767/g.89749 Transcript_35767/m.89749 type:complete len:293 (+) Transcript_35767:328-1206(+)
MAGGACGGGGVGVLRGRACARQRPPRHRGSARGAQQRLQATLRGRWGRRAGCHRRRCRRCLRCYLRRGQWRVVWEGGPLQGIPSNSSVRRRRAGALHLVGARLNVLHLHLHDGSRVGRGRPRMGRPVPPRGRDGDVAAAAPAAVYRPASLERGIEGESWRGCRDRRAPQACKRWRAGSRCGQAGGQGAGGRRTLGNSLAGVITRILQAGQAAAASRATRGGQEGRGRAVFARGAHGRCHFGGGQVGGAPPSAGRGLAGGERGRRGGRQAGRDGVGGHQIARAEAPEVAFGSS